MQIAKIENGAIVQVAHYKTVFPDTSFPPSGPNEAFMQANGCLPVSASKPFDEQTQKLAPCAPYIENSTVYTVEAVDLTEQELVDRARALIPQVVTMRQAKLALLHAGLLDAVNAAMEQAPRAAQIEWEYAQEVSRGWPTLILMQSALSLTDEQIDGLFVAASAL